MPVACRLAEQECCSGEQTKRCRTQASAVCYMATSTNDPPKYTPYDGEDPAKTVQQRAQTGDDVPAHASNKSSLLDP